MSSQHAYAGSVVLPSGRVLMVAGDLVDGTTAATDLYDPTSNTWIFAGNIASPRDDFGLALLASGKVMIAGGSNGAPVPIVEIFDPLANGNACLGPGECTSGNCVEGVCCATSSCASGLTCAGSGAPGTCLAADGSKCTKDAECGSAHCVDGTCCESACADRCAACDVKGSEGKCVPVAAGDDPHGSRSACTGSGACRARCGGVDPKACTQFPGSAIACAPPSCTNGEESRPSGCDGAGQCVPPVTRACAPYVCGATQCKTECSADDDCAAGNTCDLVSRKCVVAATCDGDHTVRSPDGNAKDCTPFRCGGAKCLDACADSSACAEGFLCDTASSRCVPGANDAATSSGGGFAFATAGAWSGGAWLMAMLVAAARRRRK
jgi:hypothetical protein